MLMVKVAVPIACETLKFKDWMKSCKGTENCRDRIFKLWGGGGGGGWGGSESS